MNIENVKNAAKLMSQASNLLAQGPLEYYLTEMAGAHEYLMERFCPFKVGDKVMLTKTPDTDNGWRGFKDILVRGAIGTVMTTECGKSGFSFSITFDDEKSDDPPHFNFGENYLVKVSA